MGGITLRHGPGRRQRRGRRGNLLEIKMDGRTGGGDGDPHAEGGPMSGGRRRLHLGAFMRPASIHTAAWRYPGASPDANFNLAHMVRFIRTLEAARFDAFFMADHYALLNMPVEAREAQPHRDELRAADPALAWPW
jgi:hypothetical protein